MVLQTHPYHFAKFLAPILNPSTISEYAVKNFFQFSEMIREQDATFSLGSLDVYSVVTNILLNGTIDVCVNQLFENANTVESFTNSRLKQLCLVTKETFFMFNYLLYKQIHGVAMGAPLGPSLVNAFLSHHKKSGQTIIPKDLSKFFNDVISMVLLNFSNNHLKCF